MAGLLDVIKEKAKQQYQQGLLNQVLTNPASIGTELTQLFDPQYMSQVNPMTQESAMDVALSAPIMAGTIKNVGKTAFETAQEVAQRNAALPVSKGGLGLPANNTAMDRAKAMGFDTPAYHGTRKQFDKFDLNKTGDATDFGWFGKAAYTTRNPNYASEYAQYDLMPTVPKLTDEGIVMPLMLKKNAYETSRAGMSFDEIKKIKNAGYDAIDNGDEIAMFNPANIRSRFAAFDPFRRNEADILAGVAAAPIGLLTDNKKKDKKK